MPGFELVGQEERDAVLEIFDQSGGCLFAHGFHQIRNGRFRVREFEAAFAEKLGCSHAQAVSSGTMALVAGLKALDVNPGDEVITQSFVFVACVEAIIAIGAVPVIVDIDDTFNMDPTALEAAITDRTKAIMPVHMLGNPADMTRISQIAKNHDLPILEDACEALGAKYRGQYCGTLGDAGVFSLDFQKTIVAGEGGVVVTNNDRIAKYCREYHDHGHENNPDVPRGCDTRTIPGLNIRITEMQAAVASAQLKKLDTIVNINRRHKSIIMDAIGDLECIQMRRLTDEDELGDTIIFSFENAMQTRKFLQLYTESGYFTKNIPDAIDWHFSGTWNHMFKDVPAYKDSWGEQWTKSAKLLARSVSLPIFLKTPEDQLTQMAQDVKKFVLESI